jgi:hypothetical protein
MVQRRRVLLVDRRPEALGTKAELTDEFAEAARISGVAVRMS